MGRSSVRRRLRPRSPREWIVRGCAAAAVLALGYVSTTETLATALQRVDIERAYALNPDDGRITAKLAEQLAIRASPRLSSRGDQLAYRSLSSEPLAVPALTALALGSELRGNVAQARALFVHSSALSRRDFSAQLWLIEDAVSHGDVPGALRQYDAALRTNKNAPEILFPILASATSDPTIASALVNVLATRPAWGDAFVRYLGTSSPDPQTTATLFQLLALRRIPIPEIATANAVNSLVTANAFEAAWNYYRGLRGGVDRRRSRDPNFGAHIEIPTAFDWTPVMTISGVTASIQRTAESGVFDFAAPPTIGGIVLQQMQMLTPGRYRIDGHSLNIEQSDSERPYWVLVCTDGREIGRVDLPNSDQQAGHFSGSFVVGTTCSAQLLRLIVRPSNKVSGTSGQIDHVMMRPLRP